MVLEGVIVDEPEFSLENHPFGGYASGAHRLMYSPEGR